MSIPWRYQKVGIALLYALLSSVAFNFFWLPGSIYANGLTGFVQLIVTSMQLYGGPSFSIPLLVLCLNLPLLAVAWHKIDHEFTCYTILAVFATSLFMRLLPVVTLTTDPFICTIFGGLLHGISVGITLKSDFSTGGLDIIGILIRKQTGRSLGSIFILFNVVVEFIAGFLFGWQFAFYSALTVFISGRVIDYVNTKQQNVQVMIVTDEANQVVTALQQHLRRGITMVNDVEGAFDHQQKKLLIVVVAKTELKLVQEIAMTADAQAFISSSSGIHINRKLFEW